VFSCGTFKQHSSPEMNLHYMDQPALVSRRKAMTIGLLSIVAIPIACKGAPGPAATLTSTPKTRKLIAAARAQIGVTLQYDPAYTVLDFPGGDVPRRRGVCTDVVIRAYRDAFDMDLQTLVNADMKTAFASYPTRWGLSEPDRNIDHRRVLNLQTYFARSQAKLTIPDTLSKWQPGDIATFMIGGRLPHIGILSDKTRNGRPLLIHNIGRGTQEEDVLGDYPIVGRYRWRLV
jgi:uncharacterized protein